MDGWIALHRSIMEHWIWEHPKRLQRWLDLLLIASYSDHETCIDSKIIKVRRGQIVTTCRGLMARWKTNNHIVAATLKLFEQSGMVKCSKGRSKLVITIVNYDKYQRSENLSKSAPEDDTFSGILTEENERISEQKMMPIEAKTEQEQLQERLPLKQNNNIINKQETIIVDVDAREKEFLDEVLSDLKIEQCCMVLRISKEEYVGLAKEIVAEWNFSDEKDWTFKHLLNQMRIKVEIMRRKQKQDNGNNSERSQGDNRANETEIAISRFNVYRAEESGGPAGGEETLSPSNPQG